MANVNRVFLLGRLTADPELRRTAGGDTVCTLRMAVNHSYQTKGGERREETLFIDVTVWGRTAENCCQHLARGREVHVEGRLKTDTWDDKQTGERRSRIGAVADRVQFLAGRSGPARDDEGEGDSSY